MIVAVNGLDIWYGLLPNYKGVHGSQFSFDKPSDPNETESNERTAYQ